jgi:RNA polymerase subunit RPABC4/transcription elongation factor Spt4
MPGISRALSSYSCPICNREVPPAGWSGTIVKASQARDREIGVRADGWPTEKRKCPACRARLERDPPGRWRITP